MAERLVILLPVANIKILNAMFPDRFILRSRDVYWPPTFLYLLLPQPDLCGLSTGTCLCQQSKDDRTTEEEYLNCICWKISPQICVKTSLKCCWKARIYEETRFSAVLLIPLSHMVIVRFKHTSNICTNIYVINYKKIMKEFGF